MDKEKHYNTTVMFIDMAGYTSKTSKLSRAELKETLEDFEAVVKPVISNFGGRIIKGMGDAYLITFHSPTNSLLASNEIQKRIHDRNEKVESEKRFEARIGLSSGEVYERGGDIFGTPVNLAARIQSKGKPGQILFGSSVYHAMNKNEIGYHSVGKFSLKGIDEKVQIYQVHKNKKGVGGFIAKLKIFFFKYKWWILALFLFLILANAGDKQEMQQDEFSGVILDEEWYQMSQKILDQEGTRNKKLVEELLIKYENSPENEKVLEANLYASIFYAILGDYRDSYNSLRMAYDQSRFPSEKKQVRNIAERLVEVYPEDSPERTDLENILEKIPL